MLLIRDGYFPIFVSEKFRSDHEKQLEDTFVDKDKMEGFFRLMIDLEECKIQRVKEIFHISGTKIISVDL